MNISLIIAVVAVIFLCVVLFKKRQNKEPKNETTEIENEMEELFLKEINNGEKTRKLSHIFDEFEFVYIETLFQEEKIPYFIEKDGTLDIWPARKIGDGNVSIYIFEKNYDDVMKLIEDRPPVTGTVFS